MVVKRAQKLIRVAIWVESATAFRKRFEALCVCFKVSHLGFCSYSLRRGGATAYFKKSGLMEKTFIARLVGQCKRCQTLPMWWRCSDPYCLFASKHTKKLVSSYRPFQQGRFPPLSSCSRGTWKGLFWAQSCRLDSSEHRYIYTWRPCHMGKLRCLLFGCAYSSINTCMHSTQEKKNAWVQSLWLQSHRKAGANPTKQLITQLVWL
jgi:hypothetical protein